MNHPLLEFTITEACNRLTPYFCSVYELCDQKLKQMSSLFDYEQNEVIQKLYNIYLGTTSKRSRERYLVIGL